jgi:hydrogenase maturation protease
LSKNAFVAQLVQQNPSNSMARDSFSKTDTLIIGIGNEYRRDDAVGLIVACRLREMLSEHVTIIEQSGEGAALMKAWKDAQTVIIIDAVHSGAEPGTIFRFESHQQPIPSQFFHYSTHAFSVAEAIELARALNQLPPRLVIFGIEGKILQQASVFLRRSTRLHRKSLTKSCWKFTP